MAGREHMEILKTSHSPPQNSFPVPLIRKITFSFLERIRRGRGEKNKNNLPGKWSVHLMDQDWKIKGKKKSTWRSSDNHPLFTNIQKKTDLKCLTNKISWQKTLEQCLWSLWGKEYEPRMSRKSVSGMKMPPNLLWNSLGKNNFIEYSNQDESKI